MARYAVNVPIYGSATVWVEAEDEDDAIQKVKDGEWGDESPEISEYEVSINACRGNICGRTMHDHPDAWLDE